MPTYETVIGRFLLPPQTRLGFYSTVPATLPSSARMLLVVADPIDSARLDLTGEIRAIERELSLAPVPRPVETRLLLAATLDDLHRELLGYRPHIIHFCGHASNNALWLRDVEQPSRAIASSSLAGLLAAHESPLSLVVVNACESDEIALTLAEHVACAIGFAATVDDATARTFAVAMYRTLAAGRSVEEAFQQAVAVIQPVAAEAGPRLHCRDGVNPAEITCASAVSVQPSQTALGPRCTPEIGPSPAWDEIREALNRRELVVVAGAGIRTPTGARFWPTLTRALAEYARVCGVHDDILDEITMLIDQHRFTDALSETEHAIGPVEFGHAVERLLDDSADSIPEPALMLAALAPRLRAVLTTNLDRAIERAFAGAWPMVPRATGEIAQRERVIFKLHGTLEQRDTWILTREQYSRAVHGESSLRAAVRAFFRSRMLLFVGYRPMDPDFVHLLDLLEVADTRHPPRHYALIAREHLTGPHRRRMARAGIRPILYELVDGALTRMLGDLENSVEPPRPARRLLIP